QVGTGHRESQIEEQMAQAAHAAAAGADQIDGAVRRRGAQQIIHLRWTQWTHAGSALMTGRTTSNARCSRCSIRLRSSVSADPETFAASFRTRARICAAIFSAASD